MHTLATDAFRFCVQTDANERRRTRRKRRSFLTFSARQGRLIAVWLEVQVLPGPVGRARTLAAPKVAQCGVGEPATVLNAATCAAVRSRSTATYVKPEMEF
jgi:hypothetical protein